MDPNDANKPTVERKDLEHDAWFRAEVEKALREMADPNVKWVSNEEVEAAWRRRRVELIAGSRSAKYRVAFTSKLTKGEVTLDIPIDKE